MVLVLTVSKTFSAVMIYMGVSENNGTPKSSILIGFSIVNHPFGVPLFLETTIYFCLIHKATVTNSPKVPGVVFNVN